MESFRAKVRRAGFPNLHLNFVAWGLSEWSFQVLPVEQRAHKPGEAAQKLGAKSVTPYVWVHHFDLDAEFPRADTNAAARSALRHWDEGAAWPFDFFPNASVGWDSSPRTDQTQPFEPNNYPFTSIIECAPAQFESALLDAKRWLESQSDKGGAITINAWNEWTEGSYLEPDTRHRFAYLEAIHRVFGS